MTFSCSICNKSYKSYQSLWNHNNKFHNELDIRITNKERNFKCIKCNKEFTRKDNMLTHLEKTCKNKDKPDPNTELKQQLIELQKKVEKLETKNNSNINNTVNGTLNNGNINNIIYINKPGTENMLELNKKEVVEIFDKDISGLLTFVEKVNFNNRLPANHSFCTKNLGGPYLSVYDTDNSKVKQDRKKYFFEEIISKTVSKMEELYKINKGYFKANKQKSIEDTLKRLNELKSMDMNKKIFKEMLKQLNILSYNDREVVETTWENKNIKGKVPATFEEDLEMDSEEYDDNKTKEIFMETNNSDHDSDSDSDTLPRLKISEILKKHKTKEIIV